MNVGAWHSMLQPGLCELVCWVPYHVSQWARSDNENNLHNSVLSVSRPSLEPLTVRLDSVSQKRYHNTAMLLVDMYKNGRWSKQEVVRRWKGKGRPLTLSGLWGGTSVRDFTLFVVSITSTTLPYLPQPSMKSDAHWRQLGSFASLRGYRTCVLTTRLFKDEKRTKEMKVWWTIVRRSKSNMYICYLLSMFWLKKRRSLSRHVL